MESEISTIPFVELHIAVRNWFPGVWDLIAAGTISVDSYSLT